jgi:hypothetical protein
MTNSTFFYYCIFKQSKLIIYFMKLTKMKTFFSACLVLLTAMQSYAQDWYPLGDGTGTSNEIKEVVEYQGDLVMGGNFAQAGGQMVYNIARWDGSAWHPMGTGFDAEVRALAVFQGELYAAGHFTADGTGTVPFPGMARWNGSSWVQVPVPNPISYDYRDLCVFDGKMYTTKHFTPRDFTVMVSAFDGNVWTDLPGEFTGPEDYKYLYALGEYNGKLIAGGQFDSVGGVEARRIAMFNGTSWESLGFPVPGETTPGLLSGRALAFQVFEDKLFAGGIFTDFNGTIPGVSVASFDGTTWTAYPFDSNIGHVVHDFEIFSDHLLAAGELGYWMGTEIVSTCVMFDPASPNSWQSLNFFNASTSDMNGQDMAIVNGTLCLGGKFSHAGSGTTAVNNIVRFDGNLPVGLAADQRITKPVEIFPNPASGMVTLLLPGDLSSGKDLVTITNAAGKVCMQQTLTGKTVDTRELKPGVYTLRVITDNTVYTAKLVRR